MALAQGVDPWIAIIYGALVFGCIIYLALKDKNDV